VSLALVIARGLEALPGIPPARLPLTRSRIAFMTQSRAYCGERARRELNFVPQVDLETGLCRTVAWYRAQGLL
jgi:nucleoside-diphosphate-sugar epimerase